MNTKKIFASLLLCAFALNLFGADPQLRLANFIISDQELTLTVGTLGEIKSASPGCVSGFIPAAGAVEIIARERFSGKLIHRETVTVSGTATLVLLGQPASRDFPPQLRQLPAGNQKHTLTFLNCDPAGAATVTISGTTTPLPPAVPQTHTLPADTPLTFTITTTGTRREKLPAPPLDTAAPDAHLCVFLYRPAPGAPAQLHVTPADSEQIFAREE